MNKAIVFDMDGVIFDTERLSRYCWQVIADRYSYGDLSAVCAACTGTNSRVTKEIFLSFMGEDFPYDERKKEESEFFHRYTRQHGMPLKDGVFPLFDFLKEKGFKIGLSSSTRIATVKDELTRAGLIDYFDALTGGDEVEKSKPEPDIYLTTCKKLGVTPCDTYAVEDSYNGVRSAASAGMKVIMVPDILPSTEEMRTLAVSVEDSLIGVMEYLKTKLKIKKPSPIRGRGTKGPLA